MLITTVGSYSSNSFITLEEAESILSSLSLRTDAWIELTSQQGVKATGTITGPFEIIPGIKDSLRLSLETGDDADKTVTFTGETQILTATQFCVAVNNQLSNITFVPTPEGKINIETTNPTDTLYIKTIDHSLYSALGLLPGEYIDVVTNRKEFILQMAANVVGLLPLSGRKVYTDQALAFPRVGWSVNDAYLRGSNYYLYGNYYSSFAPDSYYGYDPVAIQTIPEVVKESQAILACLVVQPSLDKQNEMSNDLYLPEGIQNSVVKSVNVAGIMAVKSELASSASSLAVNTNLVNVLASMANVLCMPVYLRMKPYLTQIGGGILRPPQEDLFVLLPRVEPSV